MALSTSTNGSIEGQTQTQSPQTATKPGGPAAAPGKSVQPGTADSLLSGPSGGGGGIPLGGTVLSVANLNVSPQTVVSDSRQPAAKTQHHPGVAWLAIVAIFFVLAVILFWRTTRSAKNTTHY